MKQILKKSMKSMYGRILLLGLAVGAYCFSQAALAVQCTNTTGSPMIYNYTYTMASTQNYVGYNTGWQEQSGSGTYALGGGCVHGPNTYFTSTVGPLLTLASTESDINWYDIVTNDYLQLASQISIRDNSTNTSPFYNVPFVDVANNCTGNCTGSLVSGSRVRVNFRIKRPFIGITNLPSFPIFYLYANQGGAGQGTGSPLAMGYLSASVTVPQSCTLNAGQIISIDFGSVSSGAFKTAGEKAEGIAPVSRNIGIECNGIEAQASLSLRVQADTVQGNMIVSDNPDVGFVITDSSGNPLTPNNLSSVIPFLLDDAASADVTIGAYPASVTGNAPTEGVATGRGYLRVDFQ
ncbi:mannose-binding protein [Brenneria alni]|uniref:Mannose-binding protein n=1 Tax=Brenneria alni TaxID=71656 RepID=A0A421DU66_9GAMM|nr:fimbrial protein [Brenneria alni]RLM28250.1 mannose-binding protein [Brenneria alni]